MFLNFYNLFDLELCMYWITDSTGCVCLHNVYFSALLSVLADISPYKNEDIYIVNKSATAIVFWIQYLRKFHLKLSAEWWVNMYRRKLHFAHFYNMYVTLYTYCYHFTEIWLYAKG